ncbi:hypothetical protein, partial [Streptomyces sp. NPDC005012]|uniref:hypothetical protein n=1 Tax=Streptomyces sp. NPDC005012 TaxID=3154558 RepID=UPI0033AFC1AA
ARKAAPAGTPAGPDPRFENGPLPVVDVQDGKVPAYHVGGLVLHPPAKPMRRAPRCAMRSTARCRAGPSR